MKFYVVYFIAAVFVASVAADGKTGITKPTIEEKIDAIFAEGYNQIMLTNPSPECKTRALTQLAAAQSDNKNMTCKTFPEKAFGALEVFNTAWDSFTEFITDLNTFINGIPMCFVDHSALNIFHWIPCVLGQFGPIWTGIKDFFYYSHFYMDPINKAKEFVECLNRANHATDSVQKAFKLASLCY